MSTMAKRRGVAAVALAFLLGGAACGSDDDTKGSAAPSPDAGGGTGATGKSLYEKYGGAQTVAKVVDDAVAGVLADCQIGPYFAVVGQPGHLSVERIKSCLRLQFAAVMGAPGVTYPGKNDRGELCSDMKSSHAGLEIPASTFDRFVMDLGAVLKADGVEDADIATLAAAVSGTKGDIVSAKPVDKSTCKKDGNP